MLPSPSKIAAFLRNRAVFYTQAIRAAGQVGAFTYTSKPVTEAVLLPLALFAQNGSGARVLEVGAGTGAISREIVARLGPGDRFDVYEINPAFAKVLRDEVGRSHPGAPTVRIFEADIETLEPGARYHRIISTLPLLNMPPGKVRRIFALLLDRLEPDGVLSYYDYWAKEVRGFLPFEDRRRVREVLHVTGEFLARHEVHREVVPWNLPPALVHHLRR